MAYPISPYARGRSANMTAAVPPMGAALGAGTLSTVPPPSPVVMDPPLSPGPPASQGPAQGGAEAPGTPNTSPSTAATDGLYKAVQDLAPGSPPGWNDIAGPRADNSELGSRLPPSDPATKVLAKLVRGVY